MPGVFWYCPQHVLPPSFVRLRVWCSVCFLWTEFGMFHHSLVPLVLECGFIHVAFRFKNSRVVLAKALSYVGRWDVMLAVLSWNNQNSLPFVCSISKFRKSNNDFRCPCVTLSCLVHFSKLFELVKLAFKWLQLLTAPLHEFKGTTPSPPCRSKHVWLSSFVGTQNNLIFRRIIFFLYNQ